MVAGCASGSLCDSGRSRLIRLLTLNYERTLANVLAAPLLKIGLHLPRKTAVKRALASFGGLCRIMLLSRYLQSAACRTPEGVDITIAE